MKVIKKRKEKVEDKFWDTAKSNSMESFVVKFLSVDETIVLYFFKYIYIEIKMEMDQWIDTYSRMQVAWFNCSFSIPGNGSQRWITYSSSRSWSSIERDEYVAFQTFWTNFFSKVFYNSWGEFEFRGWKGKRIFAISRNYFPSPLLCNWKKLNDREITFFVQDISLNQLCRG